MLILIAENINKSSNIINQILLVFSSSAGCFCEGEKFEKAERKSMKFLKLFSGTLQIRLRQFLGPKSRVKEKTAWKIPEHFRLKTKQKMKSELRKPEKTKDP
jgi:hypothetical protein